jgi:hypothetical protein
MSQLRRINNSGMFVGTRRRMNPDSRITMIVRLNATGTMNSSVSAGRTGESARIRSLRVRDSRRLSIWDVSFMNHRFTRWVSISRINVR